MSDHVIAHIRLPRALRARLKVLAAQRETSLRRLAAEAFEALLATEDGPPRPPRPDGGIATRGD